jgi:hypothetical protein
VYGVPTYDKAVGTPAAAPIAPVPARSSAVTAAVPMAPVAALAPQPHQPSAAKDDGWELIQLFDAPAAPPDPVVAVASTAAVTAARATAPASLPASAAPTHGIGFAPAPARAPVQGRDTAEVLRLFDPLQPLSQPPRKPTIASDGDALFFANFGL